MYLESSRYKEQKKEPVVWIGWVNKVFDSGSWSERRIVLCARILKNGIHWKMPDN